MVKETVVTLDKKANRIEIVIEDIGHFIVTFKEKEGKTRIYIARYTPTVKISHVVTVDSPTIGPISYDFPNLDIGEGLSPVDIYVEIGKSRCKKVTFTYAY